jgi:hypothetical protein
VTWSVAGLTPTSPSLQLVTSITQPLVLVLLHLCHLTQGLAKSLFGDVECRWVDAYFPFTAIGDLNHSTTSLGRTSLVSSHTGPGQEPVW